MSDARKKLFILVKKMKDFGCNKSRPCRVLHISILSNYSYKIKKNMRTVIGTGAKILKA